MVVQKAVKRYPLVKWFLIASGVLVVGGLFLSGVITDPDNAQTGLFIGCVIAAVVLPFLALAFPRREVLTMELPSDHLSSMSRAELEGLLQQLDTAKGKGEMDEARYTNARDRVLSALKSKGKR